MSGGGAEEVLLIQAVKERDVAVVRARLSEGVDVNATEPDGATALHWAAHDGQADLARILLDAGADVNATTRYGARRSPSRPRMDRPRFLTNCFAGVQIPTRRYPVARPSL